MEPRFLRDRTQVQLTTGSVAARLPQTPAPEETAEEAAEDLYVAAMVLAAVVEVDAVLFELGCSFFCF